jgi:hypothetical protein
LAIDVRKDFGRDIEQVGGGPMCPARRQHPSSVPPSWQLAREVALPGLG